MGKLRLERQIEALEAEALRALGLFTAWSAHHHGISSSLLRYHARAGGRWACVLPSVYRLTAITPHDFQPWEAALMWAGEDAVLSHRVAGSLRGLDAMDRRPRAELWSPRWLKHPDVRVHRGVVPEEEVDLVRGFPVTNLTRTVVDLSKVLDEDTLERVVESAYRCEKTLVLPHTGRLGRVLDRRPPGCPPTDSDLETRYLQLVRHANVPTPARQHPVFDRDGACLARLDVSWPEIGLVVELDGRGVHGLPKAVFTDRHRQNEIMTLLHCDLLRFTDDDVEDRPMDTIRKTEDGYRRRAAWVRGLPGLRGRAS